MDPQQTPRPQVQKSPMANPQPPLSSVQRFPTANSTLNGARPQPFDERPLNPNPQQTAQLRAAVPFGPPRPPGAPPPRNAVFQRPPGPRPGPPGILYPNQSAVRFPPPGPGIREAGPQVQNNPPGYHPSNSVPGQPRPPFPGQRPPDNQVRGPLSRNSSLSQEDPNFGPRQPTQGRLQRHDSNSSVNEQKIVKDRPPKILIDKTMTDIEDEMQKIDNPEVSRPSEYQNIEADKINKDKIEPKVIQESSLVDSNRQKHIAQKDGNSMIGNKMDADKNADNNLTAVPKNLILPGSPDTVKGFDDGERRSLSSRSGSREESPNSAKMVDGNKTSEQDKKRAHFSDDVEVKDKPKPDRRTWSNSERSPRNSARDRGLTLSVKPENMKDIENDSGVDESTQRKEAPTTNGVSPTKRTSMKSKDEDKGSTAGSPIKSPSKGSKSLPRTPDSASSISLQEKKKVPMNKVQVGAAPSPNLKTVRSKIGSLDNASYKPGGGKVKIENRKLDFSKAQPKIAAKNDKYTPSGGDKKITQVKLQWNAKPKVGSLENATYKPGGGDKKIESVKLDFKDKAKPKVGSKENAKHVPGGGSVKSPTSQPKTPRDSPRSIETQKLEIKAESKIGSLDNVKHKPGGGDKKIFNDKDYLKQTSTSNAESVSGSGSQIRLSNVSEDNQKPRDRNEPQPPPSTPTKVRTPTSVSFSNVTPRAVRSSLIASPDKTSKRFAEEQSFTPRKVKGNSPTKEELPRLSSANHDRRKPATSR